MIKTEDKFVNDIIVKDNGGNLTHINKIYNRGTIYWGNDTPPAPPFTGIRGTANVTSQTINGAIYYNGTTHNIDVDANGNWEIEENNYIYDTYRFSRSNNITSIDFRNTIWGTYPNTAAGVSPFGGMFDSGGRYNNLRDIYFDFTGQDTQNIIVKGSLFRNLNNCSIHGLGTFVWSGEFTSATPGGEDFIHLFTFREHTVNRPSIVGTYDIRGIDTTGLTDMDESQIKRYYRPTDNYGNWTHYAIGNYCTTWIVGNLEIHWSGSLGGCSRCTTLYCTSPTPPSLNRTGTYGIHALNWMTYFTSLQNIYVPVGHLSDYTNASVWSNYASLMSEQDAPDPLTI